MSAPYELIAIVGPTASGKSALAVLIAQKYNGEIISADSRQVYRGMDIGTGKITQEEMLGIPHHLIDVADPSEVYTVARFKKEAGEKIEEIRSRGKLPILCGGTGLYIDSVLYDLQIPDVPPNPILRAELEKLSTKELLLRLTHLDPRRAQEIEQENPVRLIRAIEIAEALGSVPELPPKALAYNALILGIIPPNDLTQKIEERLDVRLKNGMIEEVSSLQENGLSWERLESFGLEYKWIALFLQKKISHDEMRSRLLRDIIAYSKRQMTWFKKNKEVIWVTPPTALQTLQSLFESR